MIIKIDSLQFNMLVDEEKLNSEKIPIIFLHGFTGSSNDWQFIFDKLPEKFLPAAIDLIGHGKSSSPVELDYYSPLAITNQLNNIFTKLGFEKVLLCGYSMGGRAALNFAAQFPYKISALILESVSKGLSTEEEKTERLKNDFALAEKIKNEGIDNFINYWMNIPLFGSLKKLPEEKYKSIIKSKLNNSVAGLSNSLRGFSTGNMNIDLKEFNKYDIPVLLITGRLDEKFTNINKSFVKEFKNAKHEIIKNVGHNSHIENEGEFISIVNKFLQNYF